MIRSLAAVLFVLTALAGNSSVQAGNVATWRHSSKADFEKAELSDVVLSRDGDITLGRDLKELADLKCASVWDLVRTKKGKTYAATALPGQVVEFSAKGEITPVWADDALQAFSLAVSDDGSLFVGTGPEGVVYKISPDGKAEEFYKTGGMYVWDLVLDPTGNLYAATGPKGEIHKVEPNGKGRVFHVTKTQHVLCLAWSSDGALLAGTDTRGLVLSLDDSGQARVLYDASETEIRALWVSPEGAIYAGTAVGAASSTSSSSSNSSSSSSSSSSASNSVYCLEPSGSVRKVLSAKALVYTIGASDAASGQVLADRVLAGTGPEGTLYLLDDNGLGERQLAQIDAELILALLPGKNGEMIVATGNAGKLYRLSGKFQSTGTLTSQPLDAKMLARFGSLTWRAETPEGTQVSVAVRSGNTQTPDETWSPWSVEQTSAAEAQADCPAARFLQYRLTLKTNKPGVSPIVRSVSLRYLTANQAPQLTKLTVPHVEEGDGKKTVEKLKLAWTASDPNQDDLTYKLCYRKHDWKSWVVLKDELTAGEYEWDITSAPEGMYRVQVTVSDRRSNPVDEALTSTLVSEPFAVDRSGPKVEARLTGVNGETAAVEVKASDTISPLVAAAYSLDSDKWVNVFPADDLFDSASERFGIELSDLTSGTHVLVVRVTDASGQTSSDDVVFEVK